jgi:hypothetical protein
MANPAKLTLSLSNGSDEKISPASLLYIRRVTYEESRFEPSTEAVVVLPGVRLSVVTSSIELSERFSELLPIVTLSAPDGSLVFVNARSVADVDPPATRQGKSALVFGVGPRAPRLGVRHSREELATIWSEAGLNPADHGL